MKYVQLTEEDLLPLDEFFEVNITKTFLENGLGNVEDIKEEIEYKKSYIRKAIASNGEDFYYVLAKDGQTIAGCAAIYQPNRLIRDYAKDAVDGTIEVGSMLVATEYQKRGISRRLMEILLEEASRRGYDKFCFDSGYRIAQGVWTKVYGEPDIVLRNIWGPGEDQMIWIRDIK